VEINQYDVEFIPRWAFNSQVLTNFITEWTDSGLRGIGELPDHWVMYFDGSGTLKRARAGVVLIPHKGDIRKHAIQLDFLATNNIVEYEGLVSRLQLAKELNIQHLHIRRDSQLMAKKVQKEFDCNNERMAKHLAKLHRMEFFLMGLKFGMSTTGQT
jgi:hypothetical protein